MAATLVLGAVAAVATGVAAGGAAGAGGRGPMARGAPVRSGSARVGGTGVAGEERLTGLRLVIVLQLEFLKGEEGARALEGVGRAPGGDHRLDVAVPGVEPAEKVEHLARFRDGLADVTKFVGETLEMGAVLVDAGVALRDGPQLGLEEDSAVHLVVVEEILDGAPEGERGDARGGRRCRRHFC